MRKRTLLYCMRKVIAVTAAASALLTPSYASAQVLVESLRQLAQQITETSQMIATQVNTASSVMIQIQQYATMVQNLRSLPAALGVAMAQATGTDLKPLGDMINAGTRLQNTLNGAYQLVNGQMGQFPGLGGGGGYQISMADYLSQSSWRNAQITSIFKGQVKSQQELADALKQQTLDWNKAEDAIARECSGNYQGEKCGQGAIEKNTASIYNAIQQGNQIQASNNAVQAAVAQAQSTKEDAINTELKKTKQEAQGTLKMYKVTNTDSLNMFRSNPNASE